MDEWRECLRISCRIEVESTKGEKWFVLCSKNIGLDGIMLTYESDIKK